MMLKNFIKIYSIILSITVVIFHSLTNDKNPCKSVTQTVTRIF